MVFWGAGRKQMEKVDGKRLGGGGRRAEDGGSRRTGREIQRAALGEVEMPVRLPRLSSCQIK